MKLNYIEYNGDIVPLYVEDNKSDVTFLFLHGLNSNWKYMQPLLEYQHNYNIVAVNFPGSKFFKEVKPEEITLEWWIEITKEILTRIKTKNVIVVAHSMSGGVASTLADDPKVKKIIMMSTINPYMKESSSYSVLQSVIDPQSKWSSFIGKLFSKMAAKFKKTEKLIESFTRKGSWFNLLDKYVLNADYMIKLDQQYKENCDKMIFLVGEKDKIIGTKYFNDYAISLEVPFLIMGMGHSPIKDEPRRIAKYFNSLEPCKKRHFWQKFMDIKMNKFLEFDDEKTKEEEILLELEENVG
ncbi:alpha/beta hydrolase [Mycoplasmopsis caviae]|uniref:C-terminal truncated esterase/lipase n=1 Tax=Mycoplasmopsis caviae TaxID=55603 RepID=A0A3P8L6X4_9BACT|nr:alpha/beta hydrolase [Mycoplasmopsis caviae]VDR41815.1 C-terminal truncated esterase/lipase [Mycoplasmopsis caviae]